MTTFVVNLLLFSKCFKVSEAKKISSNKVFSVGVESFKADNGCFWVLLWSYLGTNQILSAED